MNNFPLIPQIKASPLTQVAFGLLLLALLLFGAAVWAETVSVEPIEPLTAEELGELVGPIALYPDDLVAIVLPASTYPLQIVQAVRFLKAREDDASLEPSEDWDDSVIALLNYPEVLDLMNNDLDWTWKLGEAVLLQQEEVIVAVAEFRERALVAGNLQSDEHQIVEVVDDAIEITPADPEVIYVPYYEPAQVTVYHDYPVYHYYPRGYPLYYYPYPAGYGFSSGYFWGVTSAFGIGWNTHHLHLNHYGYGGHPYSGHHYYDHHYYRRPHLSLGYDHYYSYIALYSQPSHRHHAGNYWQPGNHRHGASPRYRNRHNGSHDQYNGHGDAAPQQDPPRSQTDGAGGGHSFAVEQPRQSQQIVADRGAAAGTQRQTRVRQSSTGSVNRVRDRAPAKKARVVAQRSSRRSVMPKARVTLATTRSDRPQRVRPDRQQTRVLSSGLSRGHTSVSVARRATRSAAARKPQVRRSAQQQARAV
ncbi:MAG: DUF3300 domain-containing protein, partial [Gammaproteobacteria bacterium]|nr:DUF3300 domain-containing protein [Gammaproteobacteria bacterium]